MKLKPQAFMEIGSGAFRMRGYGYGFPFRPGDLYIDVNLPYDTRPVQGERVPWLTFSTAEMEAAVQNPRFSVAARQALQNSRSLAQYVERKGVTYIPVYANGQQLPFADNTIRHVLISNLIGDRDIPNAHKDAILAEARRVAVVGGVVVVKETTTPAVAEQYFAQQTAWDIQRVAPTKGDGFWPEDNFDRLLAHYDLHRSDTGEAVFYVDPPRSARPGATTLPG